MGREKELRIVMFPWFAFGHFIPYLHLSNKLAEKGHKITFLLPDKAKLQLDPLNLHPSLINFHSITVPHLETLPPATQTTADISLDQHGDLSISMDRTRPDVESILSTHKPDFVLYDMAHWIPDIASKLGIKSVSYNIVCAISLSFVRPSLLPKAAEPERPVNNVPGWCLKDSSPYFGEGITLLERSVISLSSADAIAIRTFREIEGVYCDRVAATFNKPVLVTGHALPDLQLSPPLETHWAEWLARYDPGSVIFVCLGSQHVLDAPQLQELAIGLEMTGHPFLMAVKPPVGCATLEELLPEGYNDRVSGRGVVHGGWVQQQQILAHPSLGCFVTHCGSSSMWEGLSSESQLVLLPQLPDQTLNANLMADELKVGVKVERQQNGWVSKQGLCEAINRVMDQDSDVSHVVRKNHAKCRSMLISPGFITDYIDNFIKDLQALIP
ncbi:UDP-glycosyltransferase 79B2-like [Spinacia oleracea]|uniref:Glycosyltransferase n=1 Tax=Spinacia oleracea TaxID=3562 RepID=A0A9R0JN03_SPIOL|nr:UDP-glycosyltransferase 79B2-like [Spinacia oleracea]